MHSAAGLTAITNPTVNSYKRINAPPTLSGATWSPNTITYAGNNRTHMIRIPDAGRFELRLADGAANPYLLQAALLVSGLDGMRNRRDPGKRLDIDMYTQGHTVKARSVCRSICSMRCARSRRPTCCATASARTLRNPTSSSGTTTGTPIRVT
jgi:glutamine synthetase